jgi:negative regulator of flagellin synthesis FlgM
MKITHNKLGQNLNVSDLQRSGDTSKAGKKSNSSESASSSAESSGVGLAAQTSISSRAQQIQKAKDLATAAPDVREDRIAALQKAIDSGTYNVDPKDIADRMVDEELQWS